MQKHYIVAGGGRTGSHWVKEIVKVLDPQGTVDHTNQIQYLLDLSDTIKQSSVLILCSRRDIFAAAVSYFVARHTDEWFDYTNSEINTFTIDIKEFKDKIHGVKFWNHLFNTTIRPQFNHVVDVWYEDMVTAHPESYLGNLLDLDGKSLNFNWDRNKNPRDYSKLVVNYQELREIYLQNQ